MTRLDRLGLPVSPAGWQLCMGAFAFAEGISWLAADSLFDQGRSFMVLRNVGIPQFAWGCFMMLYAVATMICLMNPRIWVRAMIGVIGVGYWAFLGVVMLLGSLRNASPFMSPVGIFELLGSAGCLAAVIQWGEEL